jgi:hypothetical protein
MFSVHNIINSLKSEEKGNWRDVPGRSQFRAWMLSRAWAMLTSPDEVHLRNIKEIQFLLFFVSIKNNL